MLKKTALALIAIFILTVGAFAHSSADQSTPKDGSVLSTVPEAITMGFAKPVRVTKAGMVHNDKHPTKFEIPSKDFVSKVKFTPAFQGEGNYVVEWRGLSKDGHAVKGSFSFKVGAE